MNRKLLQSVREYKKESIMTPILVIFEVFMEVLHDYPELTVHLTLFNATISEGEPQKLEHNDIRWISPSEISDYEFCPADEEILKEIVRKYGQ